MQRRTFMQIASASALAAMLARRGWAEGAPMPELSEEEQYELDTVLAEIEALGPGMIDMAVMEDPGEPMAPEFTEDGTPIVRSIISAGSMSAVFPIPPITDELKDELTGKKYWNLPPDQREVPAWPAITSAPDYLHLAMYAAPPQEFVLSAELLALLAARNDFVLDMEAPVVVFGLRGCHLPEGVNTTGWVREQALTEGAPTHLKLDCTMGLWRPADGMIALFRAGTVPAVGYMFKSLVTGGSGTSLLPTGLYEYRRGDHLAGKPGVQRGALRMQGTYPVLRTAATLTYNPFLQTTAWTLGSVHNIHAAGMTFVYGSAGCQVIQGDYVRPERLKTKGAWDEFRQLAGTVDADGGALEGGQTRFQYMLLTGLEAALAYQGEAAFAETYRPLRFGSSGPRVAALQGRLIRDHDGAVKHLSENGVFDTATSFAALIDSKLSQGDFASTVVAEA